MQFSIITGEHTADHRLQVRFDPRHSWVFDELVHPQNVQQWRRSQMLLAHEQVHYLISCLLVRQANYVLSIQGGNAHQMLMLVKATAQRLNTQYDADTNHGLNVDAQQSWIDEVLDQFAEVSVPTR
ncbi:MAG: hypothetical protein D6690_15620 [Nitrospirae bacterium]|nr:MAG: hypothetical protein D6690_15620 [Nitrospirota bacterium]